jgi:hypothetical protein
MKDQFSQIARRTRAYWFIDGLAEISTGILFVVLSIPYLLWSLAPEGSSMAKLASRGRDILLLLGLIILFVIIRSAKRRSTYPRTGYIEDLKPGHKQFLGARFLFIGGVLIVAGLLVAGILLFPRFRFSLIQTLVYVPSIFGLFFTLGQVVLGIRTGLKHFYILGGIAALASLGLVIASYLYRTAHPFDWTFITNTSQIDLMPAGSNVALMGLFHYVYTGVAIFASVFGLATLISGLFARRDYLRQNPSPAETSNEQ